MRRRIYDFDLSDVTDDPWMFHVEDDSEHVKALYDEALWEKLVKARTYVQELESEVMKALVVEPFDAVERALGTEANDLMSAGNWTRAAQESLQARALAHAKTRKKPSKELTAEGKKRLAALVDEYKGTRRCPQCDEHCPPGQCYSRPA